jgi:hypothetical protein
MDIVIAALVLISGSFVALVYFVDRVKGSATCSRR